MVLKSCVKKKPKKTLINLKVTDVELRLIKDKAKKYTNGNISAWMRYASSQLNPKKKDVTE
jgi:hypothetical protein